MATEAYMTVKELSKQSGLDPDTIRCYARRDKDPLPVRYMPGMRRGGFISVNEMDSWLERNGRLMVDR